MIVYVTLLRSNASDAIERVMMSNPKKDTASDNRKKNDFRIPILFPGDRNKAGYLMSKETLIHFFHSTNLVSLSIAREIAEQFTAKTITKKQFLLSEGRIADEYFFLEKGYMRAFAHDTEGNEVTTGFYYPGRVVFEVSSFFSRVRSKENIEALTDCDGLLITYAQLNELFHALPEFREFGRAMLVRGFTELKSRMLATITETAEERYAHLLLSNPEIFQHAPLKTIASYLGITDTSLSRIRKEFSKK
jgi:CRP-like cAMP-binding protein